MPDFLHADKENFSDEELMQEEQIRPQSFKDFAGQRKNWRCQSSRHYPKKYEQFSYSFSRFSIVRFWK
jgi:hypothetical protein